MSITVSFFQSATVRDVFKNVLDLKWANTVPDTYKVALFNDTLAPSPDTDPATYGVAPYNANEVTGTGWSAGGVALANCTLVIVAGVGVKFDADDVSQAGTTLTSAKGCLIYDSTAATKYGLLLVNFGANYSTNNGTFGIQWDATNGIAQIDLTP